MEKVALLMIPAVERAPLNVCQRVAHTNVNSFEIKGWVTPGDCYGNAVGNLDRKISEGAHYTIDLQETTLVNNDRP